MSTEFIRLLELHRTGEMEQKTLTRDEFLSLLSDYNLPFRDLRMLLKSSISTRKSRHPVIMPRPSSKCYIFEMESLMLICFSEKCLILKPEERNSQAFIRSLKAQFRLSATNFIRINDDTTMKLLHQRSVQYQDFEQVVLETALENVVSKFSRHLEIIKPALDMLLQQVEANPETNGLRRLLAVKKSLAEFEQNVELVSKVLRNLLTDDEDMRSLSLTNENEKEDIELLLSSVAADLDEIETEIKIFIDMIEDTDQFISAHLDSVRNEIIKLSLFIEIGGLIMGVGAVVSGIFGMNLHNALETHPYAFLIVCLGLVITMIAMFSGFTIKYYQLKADTSSAQSFSLLKNFFAYVDDLEYNVFNRDVEKSEFKETVEKITGLKISDKESEYLLRMVDVNRNGIMPQPTGDRKMSFYVGPSGGSLIKHNGSRLSILSDYREMQSQSAEKKFGSKLSVFSGTKDEISKSVDDKDSGLLQVNSH